MNLEQKLNQLENALYRDQHGLLWKLDQQTRAQAAEELRQRPWLSVATAIIRAESAFALAQPMI